jgi:alanine dehydrogenase
LAAKVWGAGLLSQPNFTNMKFGILAETKIPGDERVALTPSQCATLKSIYPDTEVVVQTSAGRRIKNEEYLSRAIEVHSEVSDCDVLLGVKEVAIDRIIQGKTYLFFSHTIKKQDHNRKLLKAVIDRNIRLIDYECLVDDGQNRIIGFGRFAGLVGAYNGLRAWGLRTGDFDLPAVHTLHNLEEMFKQVSALSAEVLPRRILLTGRGRVGQGVVETLLKAGYAELDATAFLLQTVDRPVFTVLEFNEYYSTSDLSPVTLALLRSAPNQLTSAIEPWLLKTEMYIAGHFWKKGSPNIATREMMQKAKNLQVIADISCDIKGPVASTLRASTIADPFYGYDASTGLETHPFEGITVMAVDNLPCELPRDASEDFGNNLLEKVLPAFFDGDRQGILRGATIAENGKLTPKFAYLQDYLDGKE